MSARSLNQLIKGAPPPTTNVDEIKKEVEEDPRASPTPSDPTSLLPSSPPQIYLNLLILEASLRQQYLTLRARKRQHTLVLLLLGIWVATTFYRQFLRPREDGLGLGGSVYWAIDTAEKVALIGGLLMGILFWATGQWERGMRWPRKWLGTTNRGLRTMNCKIVILRGPWWLELFSHFSFLWPVQPSTPGSSFQFIDYPLEDKDKKAQSQTPPTHLGIKKPHQEWAEEDVARGGDHVKILLLPKQFTPDFRENWEVFRHEYWEGENTRRLALRKTIRQRERGLAKEQGGWLWWTGWRGWTYFWRGSPRPGPHREMTPPHHVHSLAHQASLKSRQGLHGRRGSTALREREGSHSRSSSRSSVVTNPGLEGDVRERRWSTASSGSTGERRRRSKLIEGGVDGTGSSRTGGGVGGRTQRLVPSRAGTGTGSRPGTPNLEAGKRYSSLSTSSAVSETSALGGVQAKKETPTLTPERGVKAELGD